MTTKIDLKITIDEAEIAMTVDEAMQLYLELSKLFGGNGPKQRSSEMHPAIDVAREKAAKRTSGCGKR